MSRENPENMASPPVQGGWSVYLHFPFCRHRCAYCDFATTAAEVVPAAAYTEAILHELQLRADRVIAAPIRTIYFGGGTPSLWGAARVHEVLRWLDSWAGIEDGAEITLEANPGAATALREYAAAGVNRLSVGVQAVDDRRLRALDRVHDTAAALTTLRDVADMLQAGLLTSATADLILGGPGQDMQALRSDVRALLPLQLPHLSVYALTVEEGTPLHAQVARGLQAAPDEGLQARMLDALPGWLREAGLRQYEVSNFAMPGHESRHNTAYWRGDHYLAAGVGAHGFEPVRGAIGRRYGNHRDLRAWRRALAGGALPEAFEEPIDAPMHLDERLLTGLRLADGVDLDGWRLWAGDEAVQRLVRAAGALQAEGAPLALDGHRLRVLPEGFVALNTWVLRLSEAAAP